VNALADADAQTLRISIDTKATVHVGDYGRGGRSRGLVALKALDHDMGVKEKLVPGGILEPVSGQSFVFLAPTTKPATSSGTVYCCGGSTEGKNSGVSNSSSSIWTTGQSAMGGAASSCCA
jgi:hypothetical protein